MYMYVLAVALVVVCVFLRFLFSRRRICTAGGKPCRVRLPIAVLLEDQEAVKYEVRDLHAPKVSGVFFKFLVWLMYTRFGRKALVGPIKRDSNLDLMNGLYLPEKPLFYPIPATLPLKENHSAANLELLDSLIATSSPAGDSFHFPSIVDYIRAYKSGVCTPTDVAEAVLDAIAKSNAMSPPLRAIVDYDREVVLAIAAASTQRWNAGKPISLVDGIPAAVKGEFRVEPYAFRGGATFVPQLASGVRESVLVKKLQEAGAVIIGVSNMQELGMGSLGSNPNKLHLTARNPYNPECFPGGSSSGSAVSVAAGLCPIALGVDGGGSIRIPATLCGVVGLKTTCSLLDSEGMLPVDYSVAVGGPLCSSVLDMAIAMDVLSQDTKGENNLLPLKGLGETRLDGLTVGIYREYFEHADTEVVQKCKTAVDLLKSLGATIVEIKIPELEEIRVAHCVTIMSEMANAILGDIDKRFNDLNPESLVLVGAGYEMSAVEFLNAQKQRARAVKSLEYIFENGVDVIVTPATACVAPAIGSSAISYGKLDSAGSGKLIHFSFLANMTGIPGLVLPVGYSGEGLPIGLQLMGTWFGEHTLLQVAWALENSRAFTLQRPQVFHDILRACNK